MISARNESVACIRSCLETFKPFRTPFFVPAHIHMCMCPACSKKNYVTREELLPLRKIGTRDPYSFSIKWKMGPSWSYVQAESLASGMGIQFLTEMSLNLKQWRDVEREAERQKERERKRDRKEKRERERKYEWRRLPLAFCRFFLGSLSAVSVRRLTLNIQNPPTSLVWVGGMRVCVCVCVCVCVWGCVSMCLAQAYLSFSQPYFFLVLSSFDVSPLSRSLSPSHSATPSFLTALPFEIGLIWNWENLAGRKLPTFALKRSQIKKCVMTTARVCVSELGIFGIF